MGNATTEDRESGQVLQSSRMSSRTTLSARSGLIFPVRKLIKKLKKRTMLRIWINSAVYLASVIEYLVSEILDLSGQITKKAKKKIIQPNHINGALKCDQELNQLTKDAVLPKVSKIPLIKP